MSSYNQASVTADLFLSANKANDLVLTVSYNT